MALPSAAIISTLKKYTLFKRVLNVLSLVHASNNVEATFDFVETTFNFLPITATMSNEFIVKYRPFDKVECCFDIVAV